MNMAQAVGGDAVRHVVELDERHASRWVNIRSKRGHQPHDEIAPAVMLLYSYLS
jgi:NOL1/NOP2/fmu family ribosome biogenesis protein